MAHAAHVKVPHCHNSASEALQSLSGPGELTSRACRQRSGKGGSRRLQVGADHVPEQIQCLLRPISPLGCSNLHILARNGTRPETMMYRRKRRYNDRAAKDDKVRRHLSRQGSRDPGASQLGMATFECCIPPIAGMYGGSRPGQGKHVMDQCGAPYVHCTAGGVLEGSVGCEIIGKVANAVGEKRPRTRAPYATGDRSAPRPAMSCRIWRALSICTGPVPLSAIRLWKYAPGWRRMR